MKTQIPCHPGEKPCRAFSGVCEPEEPIIMLGSMGKVWQKKMERAVSSSVG